LLKETKPKYFLLENVRMKQEYEDVITNYLGVSPIKINSSLVSAQNRVRLYWSNIPNITQPEDRGLVLKDILNGEKDELIYREPYYVRYEKEDGCIGYVGKQPKQATRVYSTNGKSQCLTALGGGQGGKTGLYEILNTKTCRKPTPEECEILQTVPSGYTNGVSKTQRYKMLGNGWTVEVIKHIFKNMEV
jgi:site-specific DNA-cytosine methylase